jgi:hypothetical protein
MPAAGPLHVLGALIPDAVLTNGLSWDQAHRSGGALYALLRERAPAGLPFAVGMITHGVAPAGLDYYGDQQYGNFEKGYAFEEARPYAARVAAICHLPASMGWWKAHNFVEMAIEWLIARQHAGLGPRVAQALAQAEKFGFLSAHLAAFFGHDGLNLLRSLPAMLPFLALDPITPEALAECYQRQLRLRHGVETIEVDQAAALIEEVAAAIQPRCWAFWEDVLGKVGTMLASDFGNT